MKKRIITLYGCIALGLMSFTTNTHRNGSEPRNKIFLDSMIDHGYSYLGVPYRFGGSTSRGIDCSALMQNMYAHIGIEIPRTTYFQRTLGTHIDSATRGDLVFFNTRRGRSSSHVGMMISADSFIHAGSSTGVTVASIHHSYWKKRFAQFRRIEIIHTPANDSTYFSDTSTIKITPASMTM